MINDSDYVICDDNLGARYGPFVSVLIERTPLLEHALWLKIETEIVKKAHGKHFYLDDGNVSCPLFWFEKLIGPATA